MQNDNDAFWNENMLLWKTQFDTFLLDGGCDKRSLQTESSFKIDTRKNVTFHKKTLNTHLLE